MIRWPVLVVLALILPGLPVGTSSSPDEPLIIRGPDGPGYVVLLLKPVDQGDIYAEAVWTIGPKSAVGAISYNPFDANDNSTTEQVHGNRVWGQRVYVNTAMTGVQEIRVGSPSPPRETASWHDWTYDWTAVVFFATGNTTKFDVYVYEGTVVESAVGEEAMAVYMEDVQEEDYRVTARHLTFGETITSKATSSFDFPRPFYADITGGKAMGSLGTVTITAPDGGRRACECFLTPVDTVAGPHTIEVEGYVGDDLLFWAVAPPVLLVPDGG